jgi:hypothetical protein
VVSGPIAPGAKWPDPAPLPPEEEGRAWWKIAVPAALVVVLLVVGLVVVLGGGGDGGGGGEAADPGSSGSVDISDLDDPTTTRRPGSTTTTEETTTTIVAANGRIVLESESGITWTMAAAPDVVEGDGVTTWTATSDGITETVRIYRGGSEDDLDARLADQITDVDGELSEVKGSHIEQADGRTASYTGTNADGDPVVGFLVDAVVGDEILVVGASREGSDLDGLYLDFLDLPASFDLG